MAGARLVHFLKRLRHALRPASLRETFRYLRVRPSTHQRFHVVSCQRNGGDLVLRCLDSVYRQAYDRRLVRHVLIDDASTDDTPERIEAWLGQHPDHSVELIRNEESVGGAANDLAGFRLAEPGSIAVEVDGDDWLPDRRVFRFLDKVYADADVWMTYNTSMKRKAGRFRGPIDEWHPTPPDVVTRNAYRAHVPHNAHHLHTFRIELFHHVREESLLDPRTKLPWAQARDKALYYPMLELAAEHARHLERITYVYEMSHRPGIALLDCGDLIRGLPRYRPLRSLDERDDAPLEPPIDF